MIDDPQPPRDWTGRILYFLFGAVIGAGIGCAAWVQFQPQNDKGWSLILAGAVIFGSLGAIRGDRFWYSLGKSLKHWWVL